MQIIRLEKEALACAGYTKPGRCRILSLIMKFGPLGMPMSRVIKETTSAWFDVLKMFLKNFPFLEDILVSFKTVTFWNSCLKFFDFFITDFASIVMSLDEEIRLYLKIGKLVF